MTQISGTIKSGYHKITYICKSCGDPIKTQFHRDTIPEFVKGGYCEGCFEFVDKYEGGKGGPNEVRVN